MKRLFSLLLFFLLAFSLCLTAAAEDRFTDACGSLQQQEGVFYQCFSGSSNHLAKELNWSGLPDGDGLFTSAAERNGVAEYRIQNVSHVEVAYYLSSPDFATMKAEGPVFGGTGDKLPLLWDRAREQIYCTQGGRCWAAQPSSSEAFAFEECPMPSASLSPYGLSVSASRDGVSFFPLAGIRLTKREQTQQRFLTPICYYQVQQFQVPEGAKAIRVEVFDWRRAGGKNNVTTPPCLAQVDLFGTGLSIEQPTSSSSSPSSPLPSSSSSSSSDPDLNSRPSSTSSPSSSSSHHSSHTESSRSSSQEVVSYEEGFLAVWSEGVIFTPKPEQSTSHSQPPSQPKPPKEEEPVLSPIHESQTRPESAGPPPALYVLSGGGMTFSLLGILWLLRKR